MVVDNPLLTEEERNKAVLSAIFPCHVMSVTAERTFWLSVQPYGVDKVKVFWGADHYPGAVPDDPEERAAYAAELKAGFDRINDEDKPIIGAIAQNAKALAAKPGRLSPKERTIWYFQQYLAASWPKILRQPRAQDNIERFSGLSCGSWLNGRVAGDQFPVGIMVIILSSQCLGLD